MFFDLECSTGFRPKLIVSLLGFGLFSLMFCGYIIGSSYFSVSGYGNWGLPSQELVVWLCLLGMIVMAVSLLGLFSSKLRCASMAIFLGAGLMVTSSVISLKSADRIRLQGFERLSHEAAPLVAAIQAYNDEFGQPPKDLKGLQVDYPSDHAIKGDSLPDFKYLSGDQAKDRYHGNPWVLILETPTGSLRWDKFIYYPLQNYPSLGHGGWLEKVGDWGYVHE